MEAEVSSEEEKGESHDDAEKELSNEHHDNKTRRRKKKVHKLSLTKTEDFNEKLKKRGVIYVARVPPRMNPTKIKTLLGDFGVVTRVYLVEEDAARRKRRRKATGNGTKRYMEGWVEFENKGIAKHVARSLNNTPISMHKRNVHYGKTYQLLCEWNESGLQRTHSSLLLFIGELWNLKYLHKFKWSHLTEKVAYERRVREQKLRVEMMQARRENASYTQLVETGKKLDKIQERKKKRGDDLGEQEKKRRPRQTKPMEEGTDKAAKRAVLSSLV